MQEVEILRKLAAGQLIVDEADDLLAQPAGEDQPSQSVTTGGRSRPDVDMRVTLAAHGVPAHYLRDLYAAGFDGLSSQDVVSYGANNVSVDLLVALRDAGLGQLAVHEVIALAMNGVDSGFINEVAASGLDAIAAGDLLAIATNHLRPRDVARLHAASGRRFLVAELVGLAVNGVSAETFAALPDAYTASAGELIAAAASRSTGEVR